MRGVRVQRASSACGYDLVLEQRQDVLVVVREFLCRHLALDDRAPRVLEADDLERTGLAISTVHEVHIGDLRRGKLRLDR
jgi:hypothetical protein